MEIIISLVLIFVLWCIWDSISNSISRSDYEQKRKAQYEEEAAAARKQYPQIKNWNEHPLFAQASAFLISKVDCYIEIAKRTPTGAAGGLTLNVSVQPAKIYICGRYLEENSFYYSDQGYDRIKVGYTSEETSEACKEFATALSIFLSDYYASRENISVGKVYLDCGPAGWDDSGTFSIELRNIQPKLKQI